MKNEKNPPKQHRSGTRGAVHTDVSHEIQALRNAIDFTDQRLVDLLAARQKLVEEVLAVKKAGNLPVYHPAREENLITRRREQGLKAGLSPDYVEELFRLIVHQSRITQTSLMATKCLKPGADVLIVGGRRGMGKYFADWFGEAGYRVRILGRHDWDRAESLCRNASLILISVPIDVTRECIMKIGPHAPETCVLADVTSIKQVPVESMLEAHKGPVIGLHPMFGPTTSSLDKQIVVYVPGRDSSACQWVLDQFALWGSVLVKSDPAEHDEIMAVVQTLRHFATFTFGQFLSRKNIDLQRTLEFSSPIYRLEMGMVGRLFAQDSGLYAEIIFATQERRALLKEYVRSLNENLDMLEANDKEAFQREFARIAEWFGPFGDQALRESSFLIDKLIERF